MSKRCIVCFLVKPLSHFHEKKQCKDGHRNQCKSCVNLIALRRTGGRSLCAWCEAPLSKSKKKYCEDCAPQGNKTAFNRLRKHGVDNVMWNAMYFEQDGKCAMENCFSEAVCVDHNHKTGQVRALLCQKCNMALGFIENTDFVVVAQAYLVAFPQ